MSEVRLNLALPLSPQGPWIVDPQGRCVQQPPTAAPVAQKLFMKTTQIGSAVVN